MDTGGMYVVWILSFQNNSPFVHCVLVTEKQSSSWDMCGWLNTLPGKKLVDLFLARLFCAAKDFASPTFVLTWSSICMNNMKSTH